MKATEIMMTARNADDAMFRADAETKDVTQDWGNEATFYRFDDGSVLAVSGGQVNSYADDDSALVDYPLASL